MKKRVKSLLLCVATVVGFGSFATACIDSTASAQEHEHTYSDAWRADAEGHWHELACEGEECATVVPEKEEHVDNNNDAACDICAYTDHEHTYSEEWTVDCTNHWHAADCGHIVAGDGIAAHVDENQDGECDVCKYVIEDIHEHYFASEWSSDEGYHWHAAVCEHKDQVADKAPHELNAAGDCTVCGAHVVDVDETNIEEVLNAAVANNYKVAYGDVIASEMVYDDADMTVLSNGKINQVHFALGNDSSYIHYVSFDANGNYIGKEEQWFERTDSIDEDGNPVIFGAKLTDKTTELEPTMGAAKFLNGYNYLPGNVLPNAADDTSTLANILSGLYNVMKTDARVSDVVEGYIAETGDYVFSFNYFTVNETTSGGVTENIQVEYFVVAATFTVNDDMIIDQANFYVESYRNWEFDMDLTYDKESDSITLLDTASPTIYTYSVAQISGERTFTTPYPRKSLLPQDFELSYVTETDWAEDGNLVILAEEAIDGELTLAKDEYVRLHLGDAIPMTASFSFLNVEDFEFSFVNKTEGATGILWEDEDFVRPSYSAYSDCITFKVADAGTYEMTIRFDSVVKTITVVVPGEVAPEVGEDTANTINVETTDTYAFGVDMYSYTAGVSGTYTFTLPAGLGFQTKESYDNYGQPELDFYDNANGETVEIDLAAGETVEFYVAAITKDNWVINVSWVEGEVSGGEEETYDYATVITVDSGSVWFSADEISANTATRKLTVAEDGNYKISNGNLFISSVTDANNTPIAADKQVYALTAGEYTVTFASFTMLSVKANTEYVIAVEKQAEESGDEGDDPVVGTDISGTYTATATNQDPATLTIDATAGTMVFAFGDNTINYTYEIVDGVVNLYNASGSLISGSMASYMGVCTLDADGVPSTFQYNGYTYTLAKAESGSGEEGGDVEEPEVEEPVGVLYADQENEVEITAEDIEKGYVLYSFSPWTSGGYSFYSMDLFVASVTDANGNAVEVDEEYHYPLEAYLVYVVKISAQYVSGAGTYTVEPVYHAPLGAQENPIQLWETGDYTAEYAANYSPVWHTFMPMDDGLLTISSTNTNATIAVSIKAGYETEGVGSITLNVIAGVTYNIGIVDWNASEPTEIPFTIALTAGEYSGDGTANTPTMMTIGENTLETEDYGVVYFGYKATANGTLTLTAGTDTNFFANYPDVVDPVEGVLSVEMYEGEFIMLYVERTTSGVGNVVVNAAWKAAPTAVEEEISIVVGENVLSIVNDNTYIDAMSSGLGMTTYTISWDVESVTVEINGEVVENGSVFNGSYYGVWFKIYGENYAVVSEFTLTITAYVAPATQLALGGNTVTVTDTYNGTSVEFTAEAAGEYTFTAGTNAVLGYDYSNYLPGESFSVTLEAGATVSFVVLTEDYAEGDVVVTISEGAAEEPETPAEPDGTKANPYIAESLPYSIEVSGGEDFYIQYTATEDCTIMISYPAGNYVSDCPSNFNKDAANYNYSGTVTAGQVIVFNPWGNNAGTYSISVVVEEETPDSGETGAAVSYIGANGSGRAMKVTVDATAGTVSVIRAALAGNSLDTATGATEYTGTYSYDGSTVTCTISGCTITWNADGSPLSVVWGSATYTDFVVEA